MSPIMKSLGIDQLSVEQRIELAEEIWESVSVEREVPALTVAQRTELARRIAEHVDHPDDVIRWEQIEAGALARFQR